MLLRSYLVRSCAATSVISAGSVSATSTISVITKTNDCSPDIFNKSRFLMSL